LSEYGTYIEESAEGINPELITEKINELIKYKLKCLSEELRNDIFQALINNDSIISTVTQRSDGNTVVSVELNLNNILPVIVRSDIISKHEIENIKI
jgi:hypothetical protein